MKQSLAVNQKALQKYTWMETTEISMKGEVKKTLKKECRYGSDGKVIKTDLPGAAPAVLISPPKEPMSENPMSSPRMITMLGRRGGAAAEDMPTDTAMTAIPEAACAER